MKKLKGIEGKLDIAWSKLVKLRAGMKCEIEPCEHKPTLNSHHIFARQNKSTRWDVQNGVCLCVGHHTMSYKQSAHGNPRWFFKWLEDKRGVYWVDSLSEKAHSIKKWSKFEKRELLEQLNLEIKTYDN